MAQSDKKLYDTNITNKLGHLPIGKLLVEYSIPAIIGTLVISLYNIVDRIYIGQGVGPEAISGLALTFPIMTLSVACGTLVGAGAAARTSICMGKNENEKAKHILGNALILVLAISAVYAVINFIWMDEILMAFGGTPITIPYAEEYLKIIIPCTILNNLSFGFNNMMRASGYPKKAMITMVISALANVILDPIFIFVFDMGIKGAAIATVISMCLTTVWVLVHFSNSKHTVSFIKEGFRLDPKIILAIVSIGMSPFLINVTASLVNVIMNRVLLTHGGDLAIGAFGIINSYAAFMVMAIIGLCQGMQPIVGYNYGAGNYDRVKSAYYKTAIAATIITTLGFILSISFPITLTNAFTRDDELVAISANGMKRVFLAFPIVGFVIVTTNFFQSIGIAWKAIFLSLSRQVLFLLPMIWILPHFFELNGACIAMPIAVVIACVIATLFLLKQWKIFKRI